MSEEPFQEVKERLIEGSCVESYSEFLKKGDNPFWKNKEFFKTLPVKKMRI